MNRKKQGSWLSNLLTLQHVRTANAYLKGRCPQQEVTGDIYLPADGFSLLQRANLMFEKIYPSEERFSNRAHFLHSQVRFSNQRQEPSQLESEIAKNYAMGVLGTYTQKGYPSKDKAFLLVPGKTGEQSIIFVLGASQEISRLRPMLPLAYLTWFGEVPGKGKSISGIETICVPATDRSDVDGYHLGSYQNETVQLLLDATKLLPAVRGETRPLAAYEL